MENDATETGRAPDLVSLGVEHPIWERFFQVAPLIVVGTKEPDGGYDLWWRDEGRPEGLCLD